MATYELTSTIPSKLSKGDILNCSYSGTYKTITLPKGKYQLECHGAQGGNARNNTTYKGGNGGYSKGTITLSKDTTFYLYVGGAGMGSSGYGIYAGGWNGGANGSYGYGGSGGGATDIRIASTSLYARVIVAGGGGGGAYYNSSTGGTGGGTNGGDGVNAYNSTYRCIGATQTSGGTVTTYSSAGNAGSFGQGGAANTTADTRSCSGGGGGGWYGGSGGGYYSHYSYYYRAISGGSGGSGYVYTSSTASNYPSGCLLNSAYYLTGTSMSNGLRTGNGYITITVLELDNLNAFVNINGTWKQASAIYVNINGTWKQASSLKTNVNGTWKGG